jgi:hypothetical protein
MDDFLISKIGPDFKFTRIIRNELSKYIKDFKVNFTLIKYTKLNPNKTMKDLIKTYDLIKNGLIQKDRMKDNLYYLYIKDAIKYCKSHNLNYNFKQIINLWKINKNKTFNSNHLTN